MDLLLPILGVALAVAVVSVVAGVYLARRYQPRASDSPPKEVVSAIGESQAVRERHCSTCAHFDLDEGQALMREHHAFTEVAKWIAPAEMSPRNEARELHDPLRIPKKADFNQFGLCAKRSTPEHNEGVWSQWSGTQRRLTVLQDEGATQDCWERRAS